MAKPKTPNQKRKYGELNKRLAKYVMLVESIYEDLNLEAAKIVGITDFAIDSDKPFMWSNYPQTRKRIRDLQERFVEDIGAVIYSGTSEEWKNSNEVQDLLANKVLQTYGATIGKEKYEILYQPNNDALKAFQQRKDKGFTISDKLWNQSTLYKQELEEAISCAIQKGTSAITLSKQISKYLLDFPQLQKDYKERFGKASRAMDCEYRSIRLAASEINMAYRQAENLRWQQMDFVVGYEIKLSNNHTCNGKPFQDICDILAGKYPKDFQWTGWHPLCYSDDSEVLTNRGWKLFKDVLDDDLILSLNPNTRNIEWVEFIDRQCFSYYGEMIHFYNRSLDCLVTPEHQMVYLNKGDGRIERQAAAVFDQSKGALFRGRTGVDVKYDIHITFNKETVAYDGYVYDLTLAKNHIMYIRRGRKCFWGSNCRCYKIPILKTEEEFWEWDGRSEATTASVNEVKDVPDAFKKWVLDNQERISTAKKRNTLPYFLRDNKSVYQKITVESSISEIVKRSSSVGDEVQSIAERIAIKNGGYVTPINFKSTTSITRKVITEGITPYDIKDAVRTTIIVPKSRIEDVLEELYKTEGFLRLKRQKPESFMGYSGNIVNIRTTNGLTAEIQVNTERMIFAKERPEDAKRILGKKRWEEIHNETGMEGGLGHKYYEQWRILDKSSNEALKIVEKSIEYYSHFR
ncbi:hypothetical protein [Barnesiella intestinihominis]|uniref:hypothetical protein n=1 Tax=Barnesiella intestinihominis TaxID=487174 RepID=UPI003FEF273C